MTGHVKVGFELEMSDIKTADAATIVYGDLLHWKDCYGEHNLGAVVPSELRIADIAIWMQVRGFRSE
jgi:hypothetical protein